VFASVDRCMMMLCTQLSTDLILLRQVTSPVHLSEDDSESKRARMQVEFLPANLELT